MLPRSAPIAESMLLIMALPLNDGGCATLPPGSGFLNLGMMGMRSSSSTDARAAPPAFLPRALRPSAPASAAPMLLQFRVTCPTKSRAMSFFTLASMVFCVHVKRYADKTWTQKTMLARVKKDIARDFVGQVTRNCNNIGAALAGALGLKARGKNAGGAARASVDEEDLMPIIPKFKKPLPGGSVAQPPSFKGSAMISSMDSAMGALRGNINSGSASFGRARNSYGGGGDSSAAAAHLSGSSGGGGGGTVIPTRLSETGIVSGGDAAAAAAREMLGVVKPRKKAQGLSRLHEAVKRRRHGHSSSGGSHAQSPLTEAAAAAEAVPPPPTTQASPQPPALPPR
eukprot:TRINITY_DN121_c4_g1_i2.p3 TRINITY_DN121_c4_g1~~TRINITY_DN121_c4_g1_i2.p3  ORF type:complete len:341 (-),score=147.17 TRINITY_DN121_c4_g1_i2:464-1486(-)